MSDLLRPKIGMMLRRILLFVFLICICAMPLFTVRLVFALSDPDCFVFCSDRTGNFEIFKLEDGQLTQLTHNAELDSWDPRVSPDGKHLTFYRAPVSTRPFPPSNAGATVNWANAALWMMNIDGSNQTELIPRGAYGSTAQGVASWSPDGSKLIMAMESANGNAGWQLYNTDTDGNNLVRISRRKGPFADPNYSPDGRQIVYSAFPEGYDGSDEKMLEIHVANADGSNERRLTFDEYEDHDPSWSPDGSEIAFSSNDSPNIFNIRYSLRAIRPDGTDLHFILKAENTEPGQVTNINSVPRWSADSQWLYFYRRVDFLFKSNRFHIAKIKRDGTSLTPLTDHSPDQYDDSGVDVLKCTTTAVVERKGETPTIYTLYQNYPNPFNPSTTIEYALPQPSHVVLKVYDVLGNEVRILVNGKQPAGHHQVHLDAKDLPDGVYFYRIQAGDFVQTKKLTLLK